MATVSTNDRRRLVALTIVVVGCGSGAVTPIDLPDDGSVRSVLLAIEATPPVFYAAAAERAVVTPEVPTAPTRLAYMAQTLRDLELMPGIVTSSEDAVSRPLPTPKALHLRANTDADWVGTTTLGTYEDFRIPAVALLADQCAFRPVSVTQSRAAARNVFSDSGRAILEHLDDTWSIYTEADRGRDLPIVLPDGASVIRLDRHGLWVATATTIMLGEVQSSTIRVEPTPRFLVPVGVTIVDIVAAATPDTIVAVASDGRVYRADRGSLVDVGLASGAGDSRSAVFTNGTFYVSQGATIRRLDRPEVVGRFSGTILSLTAYGEDQLFVMFGQGGELFVHLLDVESGQDTYIRMNNKLDADFLAVETSGGMHTFFLRPRDTDETKFHVRGLGLCPEPTFRTSLTMTGVVAFGEDIFAFSDRGGALVLEGATPINRGSQ